MAKATLLEGELYEVKGITFAKGMVQECSSELAAYLSGIRSKGRLVFEVSFETQDHESPVPDKTGTGAEPVHAVEETRLEAEPVAVAPGIKMPEQQQARSGKRRSRSAQQ